MGFWMNQITEVVDRDDGARMNQRHYMRRNEEENSSPLDHIERQPSMSPKPGKRNADRLAKWRQTVRRPGRAQIELESFFVIEPGQCLKELKGVGFGAGFASDGQPAGINPDHL